MRLPVLLSLISVSALALLGSVTGAATEPTKRALTHADYDGWRTLSENPALSRDGQWLAYTDMPLEGDGQFVVRELTSSREYRVPVGALPAPPLTASESNPERPAPRRQNAFALTSDQRFAVATTFPSQSALREARRAKAKADDLPREGLVIVTLATGDVTRIDGVKSMQVPAHGGSLLAYLREPTAAQTEKKTGSDLVLRDLANAKTPERVFAHVTDYFFARDGRTLVFVVAAPEPKENGIYAVTPGDPAPPITLASGPGRYAKFAWDRLETQAVFVTNRAAPDAKGPRFSLYHWTRASATAREIVTEKTPGFPAGFTVSDQGASTFSFNGNKIFVAAAPVPAPVDARLAAQLDEDKVALDLWRWNDDFVQPMQKIRAANERKRSYLGVLDLATHRYTQLGDPSLPVITMNDDGTAALGLDDRPYRRRADYDGFYQDVYLVDATTGERRLVVRELGEKSGLRWSQNGRWIAFYRDRQWHAIDARDGSVRPLTAALPEAFFDEDYDALEATPAYGSAGWTRDGESLLVYDRHDVWQVFPDGRPARNLTQGFGRANNLQLRLQSLEAPDPDRDLRGIDPAQPLTLRGEHLGTRATGFYRTAFDATTPPQSLLWDDRALRYLGRAAGSDTILLSASRFDEYPDYQVTTPDFTAPRKVSDAGAQMKPFLWGTAEHLQYRNADGVPLSAILYKPANFDPAKKYPMIVYFYERFSQLLHRFFEPSPGATLSPSFYASNGYLVLLPDIVYTAGQPGPSAMKSIIPAVDAVVQRGFVDEPAIGLQGHSWGGYQIAYLVTQTSRFRAAAAGATVANMTSAYSGIRWGSGRPRQFQYEKTQSRIGPPLQQAPGRYIENSPVFFADRVQTPLLLLHNDHDDAVPWEQSIEFFLALRRYGKEVYLLNYNDEFHGLRRRADQKDFTKRLQQFFDHFLKGAPAPDWMTNGIPYLDRDEEKLRFRETP